MATPMGYPGVPPQMGITGSPPIPTECVTQVELSIKCQHLVDRDTTSKSDPMVVLYLEKNGKYHEMGRTENILNCLNPEFSKRINVGYYFEEVQKLRFKVYDIDNASPQLSDDDFLGLMDCTLGEVVASALLTRPLMDHRGHKMQKSTVTVSATEVDTKSREVLLLSFNAHHLDNKDFLGKSDPFLELKRPGPDGKWQLVHRTEVIKNNLNPTWRSFEIKQQLLGGSNVETPVMLIVYDQDGDGSHDLIGEAQTTLAAILQARQQQMTWPCINQKKQKKKGKSYKGSGTIILSSCKVSVCYTFLDYILGGTQINFTVAVDFTASNGNPSEPTSLHHNSPYQTNEYERALTAVGTVVQDYDSDKMFPALGFGARIPPQWQVSHEFALNFNQANPFCAGMEGIVAAYKDCIRQVQLYGPTNFAPVINHVAKFAQAHQSANSADHYFILMILTDGIVSDMADTCGAIVRASQLPMSVIIVGVGKEDFSAMNFLDGDDGRMRAPDGSRPLRDIVQFVPFYKFQQYPLLLAREVLAEVPKQLTDYYRLRNVAPAPTPQPNNTFT